MGYITSNDLQKLEHPNSKTLKDSGINELKVVLVQCIKLLSSRKGSKIDQRLFAECRKVAESKAIAMLYICYMF